jgi:hypothetical protein
MHHEMRSRNLDNNPDDVRKFTNGKVELANLGDVTIGRITLDRVGSGPMMSSR